MGKLPHTLLYISGMQHFNSADDLSASGSIMAYPDDKSMTKMGRNVHVAVM